MNGIRYSAVFLATAAVVTGAIAIIAAYAGDTRVGTALLGTTIEFGWGIAVVAVALVVLGVGAFLAPYRPLAAAGMIAVAVLAVLVAQWADISQWAVDLWTSGTGGIVATTDPAYVHPNEIATPVDFWGVLGGSLTMLGYAGTVIFGAIAAGLTAFTPAAEKAPERAPAGSHVTA